MVMARSILERGSSFLEYALSLRSAGMSSDDIERKLQDETEYGRSPGERRAQILSIMKTLGNRSRNPLNVVVAYDAVATVARATVALPFAPGAEVKRKLRFISGIPYLWRIAKAGSSSVGELNPV